ncbi:hypothetical protein WJX77_006104 [Trebouxia sp. C0004]
MLVSSHLHTECQLICQGCCQQTRFHALRAARTAQALTFSTSITKREYQSLDKYRRTIWPDDPKALLCWPSYAALHRTAAQEICKCVQQSTQLNDPKRSSNITQDSLVKSAAASSGAEKPQLNF